MSDTEAMSIESSTEVDQQALQDFEEEFNNLLSVDFGGTEFVEFQPGDELYPCHETDN